MKLFLIALSVLLGFSNSTPIENASSKNEKLLMFDVGLTKSFDSFDYTYKNENKFLLERFMNISDEIKDSQLKIIEVYEALKTWNLMINENELPEVSDIKLKFEEFAKNFKNGYAELEICLENGNEVAANVAEFVANYESSNWSYAKVKKLLEPFTRSMKKIKVLNLLKNFNVSFIDRKMSKEKIIAENHHQEIKIISMDLNVDISSPDVHGVIKFFLEESKNHANVKYYIEDVAGSVPEVKAYKNGFVSKNVISRDNGKEYFFLAEYHGKVIIMDAMSYELVTSYNLPNVAGGNLTAIVDDKFYVIDANNGVINSTDIANIVASSSNITWTKETTFTPPTYSAVAHEVAINQTSIYFGSDTGTLYEYNIASNKVVTHSGLPSDIRFSLLMYGEILYIHVYKYFYSFNTTTFTEIATPGDRLGILFLMNNQICRVGGNLTNQYPDTVSCYDPNSEIWYNSTSYINQARWYPGIAATESKVYIFGGQAHGVPYEPWLNSIEMFDNKTNKWTYIPTPLTSGQEFIKAIKFNF